ncbi:MAG: bifunctional (p)ppGpp synthetase/guanosine-3',5'-bis(diphosphate) 3'-pyrophosphohydrolase [bacterium]
MTGRRSGAPHQVKDSVERNVTEENRDLKALVEKVRRSGAAADAGLLDRAYGLAKRWYAGRRAAHGADTLAHCLEVGHILADLWVDHATVVGGLLHEVSYEEHGKEVAAVAGDAVAEMVRLLSSVNVVEYTGDDEEQARYYRQMFVALARDVRVVLIKLAGRLDVMRNLGDRLNVERRQWLAKETLQLYSPLAHRLGVSWIKSELEDLAFEQLRPNEYARLSRIASERKKDMEAAVETVIGELKKIFREVGFPVHVSGRTKHLYSIYQKMLRQGKDFSELYDLAAVRIIVENEEECYRVLSVLHSIWKPVPGTFDDYISNPKPNGYRSLHTVVESPNGEHVEAQIRTWEMHVVSEYGVAAHWRYKETGGPRAAVGAQDTLIQRVAVRGDEQFSPVEFIESVILDYQEDRVFTFTPKGRIVVLPAGSTPVDFAYRIHTDVGHRCKGARVNGQMVPLNHPLRNGDVVEIVTGKAERPSRDWLTFAKSSVAKSKIRRWFKEEDREENAAQGKAMVSRELLRHGLRRRDILDRIGFRSAAEMMNFREEEDMFAAVGCGDASAETVVNFLKKLYKQEVSAEEKRAPVSPGAVARRAPRPGVVVDGTEGVLVNAARCCLPVPGDRIVGFVSRGKGISIHRRDCANIEEYVKSGERIVAVVWDSPDERTYAAALEVRSLERVGLINDLTAILAGEGINLDEIRHRTLKNATALFLMKVEVQNRKQIQNAVARMRKLEDVISVRRAGSGA